MMEPVHFSRLKRMAQSPAHYHCSTFAESAAMRIGTMVHAMALGTPLPPVFAAARRGRAWDDFQAQHSHWQTILTATEAVKCQPIADAITAHETAQGLMTGAQLEVPFLWQYCGRDCSSRLDVLHQNHIADLKVTNSADPVKFARLAIRFAYHAQLAFYNLACDREATSPAYLIAVESTVPHLVTVFQLSERALAVGERMCRLWMEQLLACERDDHWPGYVQSIVPLDLPEWAIEEDDEDGDECDLIVGGEAVSL